MPQTIRAWYSPTGDTLTAEVVAITGDAPRRTFAVIPKGLLEQVIIREGIWAIRVIDDPDPECALCGASDHRECAL